VSQRAFVEAAALQGDRLIALIRARASGQLVGVASLSSINPEQK
jgi:hypothetical protein